MRFVRQKDDNDIDCLNIKTDKLRSPREIAESGQAAANFVKGVVNYKNPSGVSYPMKQLSDIEAKTNKSTLEEPLRSEETVPCSGPTLKDIETTKDIPKQRPLSFFNVHSVEIKLSEHDKNQLKPLVLSRRENQPAASIIHESADFSKLSKEFLFDDNTIDGVSGLR